MIKYILLGLICSSVGFFFGRISKIYNGCFNLINYIYYGWVDYKNNRYLVNKYPIVEKQNITGIKTYVVDQYLVVGDHNSTRYIESHLLDKDLQFKEDRVGMLTLDYNNALNFVKRKKLGRESYLLNELQKIEEAKIEDCGE